VGFFIVGIFEADFGSKAVYEVGFFQIAVHKGDVGQI